MTETSNQCVHINSLVTLNISDHWTRVRVQDGPQRVFGALLGKQSGRSISILNSFEVVVIEVDKIFVIDEVFFNGRIALFKETFPELDFFGFYITGPNHKETDNQDVSIQRQAMSFNESPLLFKFDTSTPIIGDKLSINIYDSIIDPVDDTSIIFHKIPIKIVSELAEQIGLDYVARLSKTGNGIESTASKYLNSQFGAINTLLQGITLARVYIKAVKENQIEKDLLILKDIYKLCQKLSLVKPQDLIEKESNCLTDQKLMVLLCALTNVQGGLSNLISKLNVISSDRSSSTFAGSGGILPTKKFISQRNNC